MLPSGAPLQPYKVGKKLSVKADLAIYSHIFDASGQCIIVSLILGFNLGSVLVTIWLDFVNSVTYVVATSIPSIF